MTAVTIQGKLRPRFDKIVTADALDFVARDPGARLRFSAEPAGIRDDPDWQVAPPTPGRADRRCEITGPTSRRMTVNALNSGARGWMADVEDPTAPTYLVEPS